MTESQNQEQPTPETEPEPTATPESPKPEARWTDKDMDKQKGAARKEGKQTAINELLGELELESVDDIKELAEAFKTVEEETATEADKERKAREKAEAKLAELEPYKDQAERYAAAIEEQVTAQMEGLPDYIPPLLEGKDPAEKLTWLSENREKVVPPDGPRGVPPTPPAGDPNDLSADQRQANEERARRQLHQMF